VPIIIYIYICTYILKCPQPPGANTRTPTWLGMPFQSYYAHLSQVFNPVLVLVWFLLVMPPHRWPSQDVGNAYEWCAVIGWSVESRRRNGTPAMQAFFFSFFLQVPRPNLITWVSGGHSEHRFLVLGLLCRHTASPPITSGTFTSAAQ